MYTAPLPHSGNRPLWATLATGMALVAIGCGPQTDSADAGTASRAELDTTLEALEARLILGLHQQMVDLQQRHATVWFAGEAENWPLVDYMIHELEELVAEVEATNPEYDGVPVAELLGEMTIPAIESMEEAMRSGDLIGFRTAYDQLTAACNGCHMAADRAAIVIQRPSQPPLSNLRFQPQ
ncbi:MAG: hypothetical protein WEA09_04935 [Gemmatimonadota bacterium]